MVTISDTSDVSFVVVAQLIESMVTLGVAEAELEAALGHAGKLREVVECLKAPPPRLPRRMMKDKRAELIGKLFPAKIDEEGHTRAAVRFALYGDERDWLTETEQVQHLLGLLTSHQLAIVLGRSGLDGREPQSAETLSEQFCLSGTQVNRMRSRANEVMRSEAVRLIENSRTTYRFALG